MGARGPAPKPTEIKQMEGTYRADRAARNEPKPRVTIPPCPVWLPPDAKKEYKRVAKILVKLRVLTEADQMALAAYAHEYAKWRHAEGLIAGTALNAVLVGGAGGQYLNPWQSVANTAFKNMIALMREFGMTPASRSRVSTVAEDDGPKSLAEKLFADAGIHAE
jgi:P27 family predicted phage terminase small subunit